MACVLKAIFEAVSFSSADGNVIPTTLGPTAGVLEQPVATAITTSAAPPAFCQVLTPKRFVIMQTRVAGRSVPRNG